jgi:hypothetical protein
VNANESLNLERYIRNGNLHSGNRFKFIERTSEIEEHRGIKADDGLVRIEYQVEKPQPEIQKIYRQIVDDYYAPPIWPRPRPWTFSGSDILRSATKSAGPVSMGARSLSPSASSGRMKGSSAGDIMGASLDFMETSASSESDAPTSDKGITVPGSESNQSFSWTSGFETGPSEVIVLQLRGGIGGKKAVVPVTVKSKPKCTTCGRTNKATSKFCGKCGTALEII